VLETNENNNARAAANSTTTTTRPIDLQVSAVTNGNTAKDGAAVSLTATVKNNGSQTSPASTVRWYLSTDNTIISGDTLMASAAVPSLGAGKSLRLTASVPVPPDVAAGRYTIGAIVDPDNAVAETNEANNALAGGSITVSYSVDLSLTSVSGPTAAATGQTVTLNATVTNPSRVATGGNLSVGFYASGDATITTNDTKIASALLPPIGAGQSVAATASVALLPSLTAGTYYFGAIVDPDRLLPESSETNNARAGNTVLVSYGPDLIVSALGTSTTTVNRGATLSVTYTVFNQGTGAAGFLGGQAAPAPNGSPFTVSFYLSDNPTVSVKDRQVGSVTINSLSATTASSGSLSVTVPSNLAAGTYYIGAIVDSGTVVRESNEVNNGTTGNPVTVR
jgi:subtilase family serine protease